MSRKSPRILFLHNPSAASVVTVPAPDPNSSFPATVHIGGDGVEWINTIELPAGTADVTVCESQCSSPCVRQITTITFPQVAFGTGCDGCYKTYNLGIRREYNAIYTGEEESDISNRLEFQFNLTGTVSGADMAQEFINQLQQNEQNSAGHGLWGMEFSRTGAVVTLVFKCEHNYTVYPQIEGFPTNEQPTIVTTVAGQRETLTPRTMPLIFPMDAFGTVPQIQTPGSSYFSQCETICKITISGCRKFDCGVYAEVNNNGTLSPDTTIPFSVEIYVNAAASGYAAFIAALRNLYTDCNTSTTLGNRPLSNNQSLRTESKSTGAGGTSISLTTEPFVNSVPAGYTGQVKIRVTSTVTTPQPAINVELVVPASVAKDPAQVVAAFAAAGYSFIAHTAPNFVITTGKNNDDITLTYLIP